MFFENMLAHVSVMFDRIGGNVLGYPILPHEDRINDELS